MDPPPPPPAMTDSDMKNLANQTGIQLAQSLAPAIKLIIADELRQSGPIIADAVLKRTKQHLDEAEKKKEEERAEAECQERRRRFEEAHTEQARKVGAEKGRDWRTTVGFAEDDAVVDVKTGVTVGERKTGSTYRSGGGEDDVEDGSEGEVDDDEDLVKIIDSYQDRN